MKNKLLKMQSQDSGEELVDLDEINKKNKEEKKIKNERNNKNKIIYILFLILIIAIIIIYLFSKNMNPKINYKSVIIFDFDKTITEKDTFEEQLNLLKSKDEIDNLIKRIYSPERWDLIMAETYNKFYDLNITISDINFYIDSMEYTPGMEELFNFLKNKKDEYILVILSAGHLYQVNRVLKNKNLTSLIDEIIAFNSYEKDGKIIIEKGNEFNCDKCKGIGLCKSNEFNILKNKYKEKNIIFKKIYYICDGVNDYCLARNLQTNDELLIRKDYSLDKYLYKDGFIKNIKCKVDKWNNGFDIINFFKNIEK